MFINVCLQSLCFSLRKNIFNHRDIFCVLFFNHGLVYFLINLYSDSTQSVLKYLKNTEVNINNVLIMTGNFNIRDSIWNSNFPHNSHHSQDLFDITDSFHLELFRPTKQISTRYSNNQWDSNLVINLMFLRLESSEYNNHIIHPDLRLISDYTLLTVDISIFEVQILTRCMLIKNSNEENKFVNKLIENIKGINTLCIHNKSTLEQIIQEFASKIERAWYKYSKIVNITKHSKKWWNNHCQRDLEQFRQSRCINDWKKFRNTVKKMKHDFFDLKIKEVANKSRGPWELMNWVKTHNLPATKAIQSNGKLCIKINNLWQALYLLFNSAQNYQTDPQLFKEIPCKDIMRWNSFSREEFICAIEKCNNLFTPELDKLS